MRCQFAAAQLRLQGIQETVRERRIEQGPNGAICDTAWHGIGVSLRNPHCRVEGGAENLRIASILLHISSQGRHEDRSGTGLCKWQQALRHHGGSPAGYFPYWFGNSP